MAGQVIGVLALIASVSLGVLLISIERAPPMERPAIAFSTQGRHFLLILGLANLVVYFGLWVYLGLSWWPLALIAPLVAVTVGTVVPSSVPLFLILFPLYVAYCRLTRKWYREDAR